MKLNNKGFAITTIIYGTLVVFLLLLASLLGMLSTHKVRLEKLKVKTEEIIDSRELECKIEAVPSGETIGNDYYTGMTLTITSNFSNVTYSLDGKNASEISLSSTKTGNITYEGKVEKDEETATCSIVISQRTEYSQRTCTPVYGSWSFASTVYDSSPYTDCRSKSTAETYGYLTFHECAEQVYSYCVNTLLFSGPCYYKHTWTRSCTSTDCGDWGTWSTTSQATGCVTKQQSRTTYAPE